MAANVHYGVTAIVIASVLAGSAYVIWMAFDIGNRLARADTGQSPFARLETPTAADKALEPATATG